MAELTSLQDHTTPDVADLVKIVKDPSGTPLSRKITIGNLLKIASLGGLKEIVTKPADESLDTDTTLQDDDDLTVSLAANKRYFFILLLFFHTDVTPDFKYGYTIPT